MGDRQQQLAEELEKRGVKPGFLATLKDQGKLQALLDSGHDASALGSLDISTADKANMALDCLQRHPPGLLPAQALVLVNAYKPGTLHAGWEAVLQSEQKKRRVRWGAAEHHRRWWPCACSHTAFRPCAAPAVPLAALMMDTPRT